MKIGNIGISRQFVTLVAVSMASLSTVSTGLSQDQLPEEKYANNITSANESAKLFREEFERLDVDAKGVPTEGGLDESVIAGDLEKAKALYDGIVASYESAAKAWAKGDVAEAEQAIAAAQASFTGKDLYRRRMLEYRRAQANAMPTQTWYREVSAIVKDGATAAFDNLVEKKKAAADAWRAVAEAAVPGADLKAIEGLKEKAFAAVGEVDVALAQFYWTNDLVGLLAADPSVTKEDLAASLSSLTQAQENLVALRRKQIEHERAVRQANVDLAKAREEVHKAFWATREAKARAAAAAVDQEQK